MKTLVSPSLLSANFLDLRSEVEMINQSEADWLHMDIMASLGYSHQLAASSWSYSRSRHLHFHLLCIATF